MIALDPDQPSSHGDDKPAALAVLDIGNTSWRMGLWTDNGVNGVRRVDRADFAALFDALVNLKAHATETHLVSSIISCVVPDLLPRIEEVLTRSLALPVRVIGREVAAPLVLAVRKPELVGVDRLCVAAAAFERVRSSCTVVDFGTAVTVDLVDDQGVFQGGAILPGVRLQAHALNAHTAALPEIAARFPPQPVGKDTTEAIQSGVCHGLVGAVRGLVEQFATRLNRWPYVVATGGDAEMMSGHCDFIDTTIPNLCLRGVGLAYLKHLHAGSDDD